jgi:hypothetical protein
MSAADDAKTAQVTVRLDLATETISGTVADGQGSERPFWGWLELSAVLDQMRGIDRIDSQACATGKRAGHVRATSKKERWA